MLILRLRDSKSLCAALLGLAFLYAAPAPSQASSQTLSQPQQWELVFQRATQEMQAAQFADAEKDYREVVRLRPAFAPGYLNLGLTLAYEKKTEESVQLLERAIALSPSLRGAQLFAGIGDYNLGKYAQAAEHLKKAAASFPKDAQAWMWLGVVELALDNSQEAAAALDKAAILDPANVDIMYHRGRAHMDLSKNIYEQMFKTNRDSWRVHLVLAQSFDEQENFTQAVIEYNRAIQAVPRESGLHEALGDDQWQLNNLDDARVAYEQEVEIDPNSASAAYKLGAILVEQSHPDQAIPPLQKALTLSPRMYHANFWLGRAEQALDQDEDAIKNFLIAATYPGADGPTMETAWYHLAQTYRKLHRREEEQAAMQKFRELRAESDARKAQGINEKKKALLGQDTEIH